MNAALSETAVAPGELADLPSVSKRGEAPGSKAPLESLSQAVSDGPGAETEQVTESGAETAAADPGEGASPETAQTSAADRVRLVQRVARAVEAARPDGEIRLRLRPPELGAVQLRMKMEDGALLAHIETETAQAQSLLTEHLPELRERLAELDIRVERFEVEWRGGSNSQSQSSPHQDFAHGDPRPWNGAKASPRESEPQSQPSLQTAAGRNHQGDLDVTV